MVEVVIVASLEFIIRGDDVIDDDTDTDVVERDGSSKSKSPAVSGPRLNIPSSSICLPNGSFSSFSSAGSVSNNVR